LVGRRKLRAGQGRTQQCDVKNGHTFEHDDDSTANINRCPQLFECEKGLTTEGSLQILRRQRPRRVFAFTPGWW
ncbi:hypothetical protein ACW9H7_31040, partial [Pseudomonas yamanorum]